MISALKCGVSASDSDRSCKFHFSVKENFSPLGPALKNEADMIRCVDDFEKQWKGLKRRFDVWSPPWTLAAVQVHKLPQQLAIFSRNIKQRHAVPSDPVEPLPVVIQDRTDQGSLPYSRQQQSRAKTFPVSRRIHILRPAHEVLNSNRR